MLPRPRRTLDGPTLEECAYVFEYFLNVLRMPDGSKRTGLESILVRWMSSAAHHRSDYVVYIDSKVICRSIGKDISIFEVPQTTLSEALWCDGKEIQKINAEAFRESHTIEKLGTEGLDLSMPSDPTDHTNSTD